MVLPAKPLWHLAGPRGALLLPMLGSVMTALAAGALHRRIDPTSSGTVATIFIGLASPATIYALDFWEHSLGLACMAFGVVGSIDATETGRTRHAVAAGLLYGIAATMRQEALVYGFVAGLVLVGDALVRTRPTQAVRFGGAFAGAAVLPVALHAAIERLLLGGATRASRGTGTLGEAGSDLADRAFSAVATTTFALASSWAIAWIISGALMIGMIATAATLARPEHPMHQSALRLMIGGWVLLLALFAVLGVGFVPGLAIAAPATTFGVMAAIRDRLWVPFALGGGPLPLVLATAFPDGALPQWGGRYLLCTGLVFSVVGLAWLGRHAPTVRNFVAAFAVAITVVGVTWTSERTHGLHDDAQTLVALTEPDDVVIWRSGYTARGMGPTAQHRSWLSAPYNEDQRELSGLLRETGVTEFVWLARPDAPAPDFPGYERDRPLGRLDFFGIDATWWRAVR